MDMVSTTLAFMDGLGGSEMLLIFVIVLVLFGGQKLPEFARGLGKTIREFKKAASGVEEEFKRALEEDERKHTAAKLAAAPPATVATDTPLDHGGPGYDEYASSSDTTVDESAATPPVNSPPTGTPAASASETPAPGTAAHTPPAPAPSSAAPLPPSPNVPAAASAPVSASVSGANPPPPATIPPPASNPAPASGHPENP